TPTTTLMPTVTFTLLPAAPITADVVQMPGVATYFVQDLWEQVAGAATGIEDFEQDPAANRNLPLPYQTGNRFVLNGMSLVQIVSAPELLNSGNAIGVCDFEDGLTFTFPDGAAVMAFGFDYTSFDDWRLSFNGIPTPFPRGRDRFVGVVLYPQTATHFTLSGPRNGQCGLWVDNIAYVVSWTPSTPTSTPEIRSSTR
ncbi:MAG TPA: hypothetical protein VGK56_08490, partial [Anaerolineales bacterium]